jgi:hypothetical protein
LALQAAEITQTLGVQEVVYHTDSQLMASNLNSEDPIILTPDWRIRPAIAKILACNESTTCSYKKIPRSVNKTAHYLEKFAFQATSSSCTLSCINVSHFGTHPILSALASHHWDVFNLIIVNRL